MLIGANSRLEGYHGTKDSASGSKLESGCYSPIVVQKGIPVKWTITADKKDLNGCNNPVTIPKYNIKKKIGSWRKYNRIYSGGRRKHQIYMLDGMISTNIKVVSDISKVSDVDIQQSDNSVSSGEVGGGGCCAAGSKATKFAGGSIPTDDKEL